MTDYAVALTVLHPGRLWKINANDYDTLAMLDDEPKPSKQSLDQAWPEVEQRLAADKQSQEQSRASALAKLSALGLTDEEIAALVG